MLAEAKIWIPNVFILVACVAVIIVLWRMSNQADIKLLEDLTACGAELRTCVRELLHRHEYLGDTKTVMVVGYVDLAFEHHKAIWLLKDCQLYGAAFALVGPVFDAWLRALWINSIATGKEIEQASHDKLRFPPMDRMLANIKQGYFGHAEQDAAFAAVVDRFFQFLTPLWRVLSGYTHPGTRQLARRFTGAQVKASYTHSEIAQALNLATMALMLLMRAFFVSMGKQAEADEVEALLMQYFAEFNERLNKGQ